MALQPFPEFDRSWLVEMAPHAHPAFRSGRGISRQDVSIAVFSTRRCTPSPAAALDAYDRGEIEAGCFVTAPDRYELVLIDVIGANDAANAA
jgi:hypothetical protein